MEYLSTNVFRLSVLFKQEKEDTLLITAARSGKEDVVSLLLHAGAVTEATNKVNNTVGFS